MKYGIGYTYIEELRKQHYDVDRISAEFENRRSDLEQSDSFCYDRFIEHGSDSNGNVGDKLNNLKKKTVWCTNHYLGLNRHPVVIEKTIQALSLYGTGSGTSSVSGGRCKLHFQIEEFLKDFLNKEDVVLFPTGYSTNLGMISTIVQKNDLIISDSENHASIIDGIKLSSKNRLSFKHNDINDLENKLIASKGKFTNTFVIIESAYSMSGDISPLEEIGKLKKKYNFLLYLDEAHTFGFYGPNGRGLASELNLLEQVDFYTSTFSKSCGAIGGFCAFSKKFRTFVTIRASSYLFQATFPPSAAATILAALELFSKDNSFAESLHRKNLYMRKKLKSRGFNLGQSQSPIIPIFIPDINTLTMFETEMYQKGIFAVSIIYPAVKHSEGRIRLIVNDLHSFEEIDETVEILVQLGIKHKIIEDNIMMNNQEKSDELILNLNKTSRIPVEEIIVD